MSQPITIIPFFSACMLSLLTLLFGSVNGAGANEHKKDTAPSLLPVRESDGRRRDQVSLKTVGQKTTIHINRLHGIDSRDLILPPGWLNRGGKVNIVFANFPFLEGLTLNWQGRTLETSLGQSPKSRLLSKTKLMSSAPGKSEEEVAVNIRLVKKGRDILFDVPTEFFEGTGENETKDCSQPSIMTVTWIDAYR